MKFMALHPVIEIQLVCLFSIIFYVLGTFDNTCQSVKHQPNFMSAKLQVKKALKELAKKIDGMAENVGKIAVCLKM